MKITENPVVICKNSNIVRVQGYWKNDNDKSTFSYPVPRSTTRHWFKYHKSGIVSAIRKTQMIAEENGYRGWSTCRICGCHNGSTEFTHEDVLWPSGFIHYVEVHDVCPDDWFLEFIGYPNPTSFKS